MCAGLQIHTDVEHYQHHKFKPYKLIAGILKALKTIQPDLDLWRRHYYEYEPERLAIDVINGGSDLRNWIDSPNATFDEFETMLSRDEIIWREKRENFIYY